MVLGRRLAVGAALAATFALSGCGGDAGGNGNRAQGTGSATQSPTAVATTSSAPATSSAPTSSGPSMSPQLVAAVNTLSERSRALTSPEEIRSNLQAGNERLGNARIAVNQMRDSAYGAAKNCSAVNSQHAVVVSNTSGASANSSVALTLLDTRRGLVTALTDATNAVEATVTWEGSTLDAQPNVKAAVASARQQVTDETDMMSKLTDAANSLSANARDVRGNGDQIASRAC